MPREKRKTGQVLHFRAPFRGAKLSFPPHKKPKKSKILSSVFLKTYAVSPQVHDFYPTSIGIFVVACLLPNLTS